MGVRFVLGRAGAGKSQWCFQQIAHSLRAHPMGPAILWIVPRQATFQTERLLACTLGGYFRVRVVSFEDLGREILQECGGSGAGEVSDSGRRMILGHLLRKHQPSLKFFHAVAHQPGVAAELQATFAELQRCDQTAAQIAQNLDQLNPALADKLHDLALLHTAYTEFLGKDRLDPERRLAEALAAIQRCESLREADVYVDGFYDFTRHERRVLAGLAKTSQRVNISLTIDPQSPCIKDPHKIPEDLSLFHKTEEAYRRLWFTFSEEEVSLQPPILLAGAKRFSDPGLAALQASLGPQAPAPADAAQVGAIELLAAPDRRAEVDAAARWIRGLIAQGHRYRDIAVTMRSEEEYRDLIDASFREHAIPFFVDRRRTAAHHPLLRLIRAALAAARTKYSHDALMAILKTAMVGLSPADTDTLENYVLLHGIAHQTWVSPLPWKGNRRPREESDDASEAAAASPAQVADGLRRRVIDHLAPFVQSVTFAPAMPVRDFATAVFKLLEGFNARTQIVQWMESAEKQSRLEERGEHERVWKELIKLFDELVDLFGSERISLDDFLAILDSALEGFDLALAPPTVDQVLVGAVDRMRTPPLAACVVLGLCESQFPRASREGTVFSDADRRALSARKIDLDPDTQRRLLDESFWGYIAFTRASQHLLLTRGLSDAAGRSCGPSVLWNTVVQRFPGITVQTAPREQEMSLASIATPRQLVSALMRWVRAGGESSGEDSGWASVYQWLAERDIKSDAIDTARYRAWKALSHLNAGQLSAASAKELFASPLNATISQLESFASCPYQHFLRFGLGLSERVQREVSGADLSQVYHDVLDHLVRSVIQTQKNWTDLDDPAARQILSDLTAHLGEQLRDQLMLSTARNRYLLDHIEKTLRSVVAAQRQAAARGQFRAAWTSVRFGSAAGAAPPTSSSHPQLPPLQVRSALGNEVLLRGKIDRIDVLPDGTACVVDYRLAIKPLDAARAFHGLSLQLLTYLLVLEKNGRHLTSAGNLTPAAAFCVQLLRRVRTESPHDSLSPDDPLFHLREKPRGIFDARRANDFDKDLALGPSQVVSIHINKDGGLGYRSTTDAVLPEEFSALLAHIERRIGELADAIIAGQIGIRPSRLGQSTPCPRCQFRDVCRFEPAPGGYVELETMRRVDMLQRVMENNPR